MNSFCVVSQRQFPNTIGFSEEKKTLRYFLRLFFSSADLALKIHISDSSNFSLFLPHYCPGCLKKNYCFCLTAPFLVACGAADAQECSRYSGCCLLFTMQLLRGSEELHFGAVHLNLNWLVACSYKWKDIKMKFQCFTLELMFHHTSPLSLSSPMALGDPSSSLVQLPRQVTEKWTLSQWLVFTHCMMLAVLDPMHFLYFNEDHRKNKDHKVFQVSPESHQGLWWCNLNLQESLGFVVSLHPGAAK